MKVIGVSVDLENLPSKEVLISMAMKTRGFVDNPLAEQEIEAELKKLGLYKELKEQTDGLHTRVETKFKPAKKHTGTGK